jgi:hypothetical protein
VRDGADGREGADVGEGADGRESDDTRERDDMACPFQIGVGPPERMAAL